MSRLEKPPIPAFDWTSSHLDPGVEGDYCLECETFVPKGRHFLGLKNWWKVPYCSVKCHQASHQKVRDERASEGLLLCSKQHPVYCVELQNDGSWEYPMPSYYDWRFHHTVPCVSVARFRVASSKRDYCEHCLPKTAIQIICLRCETQFKQGECCGQSHRKARQKAGARQRLLESIGFSPDLGID